MIIKQKKHITAALFFISGAFIILIIFLIAYSMTVRAEKDCTPGEGIVLPILMYHSVCINDSANSEYIISPDRFEEDMKYLKEHGYETVFIADVINYVKNNGTLPEKPIVLTFDDGFYNNLTNVLPVLSKYRYRANVNIVGEFTDQYNDIAKKSSAYAYLSWKDISTLYGSGLIEIGSHTYGMHKLSPRKGCSIMPGEKTDRYRSLLEADITKLADRLKENCGITCNVFAYPYGAVSNDAVPVLREAGFEAALTCYEKINKITREPDILFNLGRINRGSHYTTAEFMEKNNIK